MSTKRKRPWRRVKPDVHPPSRKPTKARWLAYVGQNGTERMTSRQRRRLVQKARTHKEIKFLSDRGLLSG